LSQKEEHHINELGNAKIKHDDKMKSFQQAIESDAEKTRFRSMAKKKVEITIEEKLRDTENKLKTEITNNQTLEKNYN
jgi:hypothetical protein